MIPLLQFSRSLRYDLLILDRLGFWKVNYIVFHYLFKYTLFSRWFSNLLRDAFIAGNCFFIIHHVRHCRLLHINCTIFFNLLFPMMSLTVETYHLVPYTPFFFTTGSKFINDNKTIFMNDNKTIFYNFQPLNTLISLLEFRIKYLAI